MMIYINEETHITAAKNKQRIWEIDALRGLCIILMVLYHMLYDLEYLFGRSFISPNLPVFKLAVPLFAGTFIFLSGVCTNFSRSSFKRGCILLIIAMGFTVVTFLYSPDEAIYFGILHLLAACMILSRFIGPVIKRLSIPALGVICAILLALGIWFSHITLPTNLLLVFGITKPSFATLDYFPLFPWLFVFIAGMNLGNKLYRNKASRIHFPYRFPVFSFCGRYSLWIYILHQPILLGVFSLIFSLQK